MLNQISDETATGAEELVAQFRVQPTSLTSRHGIEWSAGKDDLDSFLHAAVRVGDGGAVFRLLAYEHDPDASVLVLGSVSADLDAQLALLVETLDLAEALVIGRRPALDRDPDVADEAFWKLVADLAPEQLLTLGSRLGTNVQERQQVKPPRSPGLPPAAVDRQRARELAERAEARMLAPARDHGYDLPLLGTSWLPEGQIVVVTPSSKWLLVDAVEYLSRRPPGSPIAIPRAQQARLAGLARAGVQPDVLWFAHELPSTEEEVDLAAAAPALVGTAGVAPDPILLGGAKHRETALVQWFVLADWQRG